MFPVPELHITPDTIRLEVPGLGVLLEEPAALVVTYRPRRGALVLAVGRQAEEIEQRGFDPIDPAKVEDPAELLTRIVRAADAPWWRADAPVDFDPWAHEGECVVLWPFRPETYEPACGEAIVRYLDFMARRSPAERLRAAHPALRAWVWLRRSVCHLAEPPPSQEAHLVLAEKIPLARSPDAPPPRPLAQLTWRQWAQASPLFFGSLVFGAVFLGVVRSSSPPLDVGAMMGVASAFCAWASLGAVAEARRRGARAPYSRERLAREAAVRARLEAVPTGGRETDYAARRALRLQPDKFLEVGLAVGMLLFPLVILLALGVPSSSPRHNVVMVTLFAVWLLVRVLLAARIDLGERGLRIRPLGLVGRPLFLPYAHLRSAVAASEDLRLLLDDGEELRLRAAATSRQPHPARAAIAVEEAIRARLGSPRPARR